MVRTINVYTKEGDMMRVVCLFGSALVLLVLQSAVMAQSTPVSRFELGAEFTNISLDESGIRNEPGIGARFTLNLNKNVALDAAGYLFPSRCFGCEHDGRLTQVVGGVKAGKRFKSWGLFGKARPGFVNFSSGQVDIIQTGSGPLFPFEFRRKTLTAFAADLGAVLEFYPSKRIVTRFDAGDTLIHFKQRTTNGIVYDFPTNSYKLLPFNIPAKTTHNFQFSAGVGFRF
jgi:hypothetical protein